MRNKGAHYEGFRGRVLMLFSMQLLTYIMWHVFVVVYDLALLYLLDETS